MSRPAWDVRDDRGVLVTDLSGLARALGSDPETAAKHLLAAQETFEAAPIALQVEVKAAARKKPGDGTPPPISTGNFVSWPGGKGRVDLLVSSGKVPGVDGDVEGTSKSPAARVTVWSGGKPTKRKIAMSTHRLKRIAPLDKAPEKKSAPAEVLVAMVAAADARAEALHLPEHAQVTGIAVKAAYDRGCDAWPGPSRTTLSREEWALARAEHFVKAAAGVVGTTNDADLLHKAHPLARGQRDVGAHPDSPEGRGQVVMGMDQVQADLARIMEGID